MGRLHLRDVLDQPDPLGLFIFYQIPSTPDGSLVFARVLAGLYLVFQAITCASPVTVIPKAGDG